MTSIDITSLSEYFSSPDKKTLQGFFTTYDGEETYPQHDLSNDSQDDSLIYSATNTTLTSFLTTFVPNDLSADIEYTSVNNFNPYENELDHQDICDQIVDINEIGYIINTEELSQNSYFNLDNSQSNILTFFNEAEPIAETLEEFLQKPYDVLFSPPEYKEIIRPKTTVQKEKKSKRGRGRPRTEISKLQKKVIEAEKSNDKHKTRITKNNQASKEYRDRKAAKKQQLDMDLSVEADNYRKLKKIHSKMSLRIKQLEDMLKIHLF